MTKLQNVPLLRRMLEMVYTLLLVIIISGIVGFVLAFPVSWLWNYVFGDLYRIDFWQAWALTVLISIVFGNKNPNGKK